MACQACSSENLRDFFGELTVAFPGVQRLNLSPFYACQKTLVCMDCGYTELVVPAVELGILRKGMESPHSKLQFATEYSRLQWSMVLKLFFTRPKRGHSNVPARTQVSGNGLSVGCRICGLS